MIRLAIKPKRVPRLRAIFIDEKTMVIDHYDKGTTSKQLDQTMLLLQKAIDSICSMTISTYQDNTYTHITGKNDWVRIVYDVWVNYDELRFVEICSNDKKCLISDCSISYDDFKNLLIAQNKENELAYLLLQGVTE